jgi:phosphomannomutase
MKKKIIAFDLDGTLAPSKSPLPDRMAGLLDQLLDKFQVCVISGGKFELFQRQLLGNLHASPERLANLHLMPTSGTRYYTFDVQKGTWKQVYAENLTKQQKLKIIRALNEGLDESGLRPKKTWGKIIEDRDSQITLSLLGQDIVEELGEEGLRMKEAWDPTGEKKLELRKLIAPRIPEFEVRAAGATSIDVTKPGIDKAYGMQRLMEYTHTNRADILYLGDKIIEGGNDYPVKAMGIDSIAVEHWEATAIAIEAILAQAD